MSHFPSFEVIPAVDVQDGEVVQLVGGERGTGKRYGDPVEAAERWIEAGAETLHLVDLDGAFEGERVNADAIEAVVENVPDEIGLQLGGGIRTAEGARELLDLGLDRVILGTAAVETPEIVAEIDETHPGSVVVSLDAKDGEVVVSGWTEGTGLDRRRRPHATRSWARARSSLRTSTWRGSWKGSTAGGGERRRRSGIPVIASGAWRRSTTWSH